MLIKSLKSKYRLACNIKSKICLHGKTLSLYIIKFEKEKQQQQTLGLLAVFGEYTFPAL